MKRPLPLEMLSLDDARELSGLVFDLDDTVLDHGALTEVAYGALFRLRESGLRLVACTGRPAGWADVVLRQWPIDAAIAENGAVGLVKQHHARGSSRVIASFPTNPTDIADERDKLLAVAREFVARFPEAALADDNAARWTDVTIDIGEHRNVGAETIAKLRDDASSRGLTTFVSSVHLHLSRNTVDKAIGTLRLLDVGFGESRESVCRSYAFVGDSGNDASAFSLFRTTFGVANVAKYLHILPNPPKFVTNGAMGAGFAELASRLVMLR